MALERELTSERAEQLLLERIGMGGAVLYSSGDAKIDSPPIHDCFQALDRGGFANIPVGSLLWRVCGEGAQAGYVLSGAAGVPTLDVPSNEHANQPSGFYKTAKPQELFAIIKQRPELVKTSEEHEMIVDLC